MGYLVTSHNSLTDGHAGTIPANPQRSSDVNVVNGVADIPRIRADPILISPGTRRTSASSAVRQLYPGYHLHGLIYLDHMKPGVEPISVEQYRGTGTNWAY